MRLVARSALLAVVAPLALVVACSGGATGPSTSGSGADGGTGSGSGSGAGNGSGTGSGSGSGTGSGAADCGEQAIPPALSGGCAPRVVTPAVCELVDLSGGSTYEIAWTTDGTGCETPWKLCAAGTPVTDENSACVELSTNVEAGISKTGGIYRVSAADLEGLTSESGVYHLLVASFHQSHGGSVAFRVKR